MQFEKNISYGKHLMNTIFLILYLNKLCCPKSCDCKTVDILLLEYIYTFPCIAIRFHLYLTETCLKVKLHREQTTGCHLKYSLSFPRTQLNFFLGRKKTPQMPNCCRCPLAANRLDLGKHWQYICAF